MKKIDQELLRASKQGDVQKVKSLLDIGANINAHGRDFRTPLIEAIEYYHNEIVTLLIKNGASLNCKDISGHDPYWIAVKSANVKATRIITQHTTAA